MLLVLVLKKLSLENVEAYKFICRKDFEFQDKLPYVNRNKLSYVEADHLRVLGNHNQSNLLVFRT